MTEDEIFHHHEHLAAIAAWDVDHVLRKDRSYGASWKKRGGTGAFMMLARKWDRIEEFMKQCHNDIFAGIAGERVHTQGADGTVIAEVRDLRHYLLLVEAEMVARGHVAPPGTTVTLPGEAVPDVELAKLQTGDLVPIHIRLDPDGTLGRRTVTAVPSGLSDRRVPRQVPRACEWAPGTKAGHDGSDPGDEVPYDSNPLADGRQAEEWRTPAEPGPAQAEVHPADEIAADGFPAHNRVDIGSEPIAPRQQFQAVRPRVPLSDVLTPIDKPDTSHWKPCTCTTSCRPYAAMIGYRCKRLAGWAGFERVRLIDDLGCAL